MDTHLSRSTRSRELVSRNPLEEGGEERTWDCQPLRRRGFAVRENLAGEPTRLLLAPHAKAHHRDVLFDSGGRWPSHSSRSRLSLEVELKAPTTTIKGGRILSCTRWGREGGTTVRSTGVANLFQPPGDAGSGPSPSRCIRVGGRRNPAARGPEHRTQTSDIIMTNRCRYREGRVGLARKPQTAHQTGCGDKAM